MDVIVQKFGGATLATPEKILSLAKNLSRLHDEGKSVIVVVSAMGRTTNDLLELSKRISSHPPRRELDMLLTTGERISMSLMSMALIEHGYPAISFTGSQAGLFTDENHSNAFIVDIKPIRVDEALKAGKIVVTAGFQGVSPLTKEVTTLGRGGSDTTAVALAAHFNAQSCEILKEVDGVYTADPNKVKDSRPILSLTYDQLIDMTFWGAKVLHARAAELAGRKKVPLVIKAAHNPDVPGTRVGEDAMYEFQGVLSVNSHDQVLRIQCPTPSMEKALSQLDEFCVTHRTGEPQILKLRQEGGDSVLIITAPAEILSAMSEALKSQSELQLILPPLSTVTATCTGTTSPALYRKLCQALEKAGVRPLESIVSGLSVTYFVESKDQQVCLNALHQIKS